MRIMFKGVVEKRRRGCHVCGKRAGSSSFTTMKTYILPSGITKTFRVGHAEEVSDKDGEFLLMYKYTDKDGQVQQVFEVV